MVLFKYGGWFSTRNGMIQCPNCKNTFEDQVDTCPSCGIDLVEHGITANDLIGQTIQGKYKIIEKIGQGGMGVVYKVEHLLTPGKFFALKLIHPHLSQDPMVKKRFLREVEMALNFVHENAVQIRDFGNLETGELYFTMDFIDGKSLKDILREEGRLEPARAINLIIQVIRALGKGHEQGIVHRDIKPDNILITKTRHGQEQAMVLDFGIAKAFEGDGGTLTQVGGIVGTPKYMSPEQIQGQQVDHMTDLYSAGVILYEMITGRVPFEGDSTTAIMLKHIGAQPMSPRKICPDLNLPIELEHVVLRALAKDKRSRFQSAQDFIQALESIPLSSLGSTTSDTVADSSPVESLRSNGSYGEFEEPTYAMTETPTSMKPSKDEGPTYVTVSISKSSQILQYVLSFAIILLILGILGGAGYFFVQLSKKRRAKRQKMVSQMLEKAKALEEKEQWQEAHFRYEKIAEFLEKYGYDSEATKYWQKAKICQKYADFKNFLEQADQAIQEKDYDVAKKLLKKAQKIAEFPEKIQKRLDTISGLSLLDKAQTQIEIGEYESAVRMLEKALAKYKDNPKIRETLKKAREYRSYFSQIQELLKKALVARKEKKWKEAIDLYQKIQNLSKFLPTQKSYQDVILSLQKHWEDEQAFQKVQKLASQGKSSEDIQKAIKVCKDYLNKYDDYQKEGITLLKELKNRLNKLRLQEYSLWIEKCKQCCASKEWDKAKEYAIKASKVYPEQGDAYFLLAQIYEKENKWEKVLENYKKSQMFGKPPSSLNWAKVYYHLGKFSEAEKHINLISKDTPESLYYKGLISNALFQSTQNGIELDRATKSFEKLIRTAPSSYPKAYYYLGSYYLQTKGNDIAVSMYIKFLSLVKKDPSSYLKEIGHTRKEILALADFYPLIVGKKWIYQRKLYGSNEPHISLKTVEILDEAGGAYTAKTVFSDNSRIDKEKLEKSDGFLIIRNSAGKKEKWLKIPAQIGDTWNFDSQSQAKVIRMEDIVVQGKTYVATLKVKISNPSLKVERLVWFAPQVGIVRYIVRRLPSGSTEYKTSLEEELKEQR